MSDLELKRPLADAAATTALGAALGDALRDVGGAGCFIVALHGALGAGKTTLVRGLLQHLGIEGPVRSPTFTLVEPYAIEGRDYFHLDLYRIGDPQELEFLGLRDWLAADCVLLVEWPERASGVLPTADLDIWLHHEDDARRVEIRGNGAIIGRL